VAPQSIHCNRERRWSAFAILAVCVLHVSLFTSLSFSQESQRESDWTAGRPDSTRRVNVGMILFDKNLNTYNWMGRLLVDTSAGLMHVGLNALYLSNIIQVEGGSGNPSRKLESTQQSFALNVRRPINEYVGTKAQWSSLIYTDNKGVGLSNASNHAILGGLVFHPMRALSISPMVGYRWDSQADIRDRGMSWDISALTHGLDFDGYLVNGRGQFHRDALDPRTLERDSAVLDVQKFYSALTRDSLQMNFSKSRREFYLLSDSTVEQRTEHVFSFANLLAYEIDRTLLAALFINIGSRILDKGVRSTYPGALIASNFDTEIDEFRLDTYAQALYQSESGRANGMLRLGYSERSESHRALLPDDASSTVQILHSERNRQEQTKDNFARRLVLAGSFAFPLSFSDRCFVEASANMLRYDTPSLENLEDRDELLLVLTVSTSHRISRYFELGLRLDGTLGHLVYLLKERSANNNINRVLRLSPTTIVRPASWCTSYNTFEVLANYTVYDFEEQSALARSFSYRQFGWLDSTAINFTHRVGMDVFAYLKVYERGLFRWKEFTERTENSFVDRTFAAQVRFSPNPSVTFAVGVKYFSQTRYVYAPVIKQLDSFISSAGPTCAVSWNIGPHSRLTFRGWYERRKQAESGIQSLASMTMNLLLHL
jgi:hypothetical protein